MKQRGREGIIFAIIFFDLLGFGIIIPQLGIFSKHYAASGFQQGLLVGSYAAMQFLFAPLLGRWSDRVGRRPVLLVSLFTSFLAHLLFAVAHSLTLLFVSRIVDGIGGANISTAQAYLSDVTPPDKRSKAMARIGMSFGLGFILGPALGGFIGQWGTLHLGDHGLVHGANLAIGLLAAGCSLITMLLTAFRLPESLPPEQRHPAEGRLRFIDIGGLREALAQPVLPRLLLVSLVSTSGFAVLHAILTYFVLDTIKADVSGQASLVLAQSATTKVFAAMGIASFFGQGLVHPLAKHTGEAKLLRLGLVLQIIALGLMPTVHSMRMLLLLLTPLSLGSAFCVATLPALISLYSPAGRRGEILGVNASLGSLGRIGGPLSGGLLYDLGRAVPFWVGGLFCLVALLFAIRLPARAPQVEQA